MVRVGARLTWIELDNRCILKYLSAHYPLTLDEGKSRVGREDLM